MRHLRLLRRLRPTRPLLALAMMLLGGCTLLNLDGFQLPESNPNLAQCAIDCAATLNAVNGFPDTCRPYECGIDGECLLANDVDRCDGADNDCDGKIDEDPAQYAPAYAQPIEYVGEDIESMSVATDGNAATLTWTTRMEFKGFTQVLPTLLDPADEVRELNYRTNKEITNLATASELTAEDALDNCWSVVPQGSGDPDPLGPTLNKTRCNFVRIASARVRDVGLIASINSASGCREGQLRIGHTGTAEPSSVLVTGPSGRSNSWLGLGLTPDGRCSSTQPLDCPRLRAERLEAQAICGGCADGQKCIDGGCVAESCEDSACGAGTCICETCYGDAELAAIQACGFTDVNIAATRPAGNETRGVLTAVSGSTAEARCSSAGIERDVVVIGAYQETTSGVASVTTTNEGQPEIIGRTTSSAAPAITGIEQGFLVAYPPVAGDGLALHVIRSLPPRTNSNPLACEPVPGPDQMCGGTSPQQPLCLNTVCGSDVGECVSGRQTCVAGRGFCEGVVLGTSEICNNRVDEDCDGIVDENPAALPCIDACVPSSETCNGRDDDCDGMVDEETDGAACGRSEGACQQGVEACRGGVTLCIGEVEPLVNATGQGIERCTTDAVDMGSPYGVGIDDDCDGRIDEERTGGCPTDCTPMPGAPAERCNGRDDDNDCQIDEAVGLVFNDRDLDYAPSSQRPAALVRQCLATPSLGDVDVTRVDGSLGLGQIDNVAMTAIERDNAIVVGVTWREVMAPQVSMIGFRQLEFDASCVCLAPVAPTCSDACREPRTTFGALRGSTEPVALTTAPQDYTAPSIAFQPEGLLVPGVVRGDRMVTRGGGFFVSWATQNVGDISTGQMFARPVAEHDGRPLNDRCTDDCAYPLTREFDGPTAPYAQYPLVYADPEGTRFVYLDGANDQIVTGSVTCQPAMR